MIKHSIDNYKINGVINWSALINIFLIYKNIGYLNFQESKILDFYKNEEYTLIKLESSTKECFWKSDQEFVPLFVYIAEPSTIN